MTHLTWVTVSEGINRGLRLNSSLACQLHQNFWHQILAFLPTLKEQFPMLKVAISVHQSKNWSTSQSKVQSSVQSSTFAVTLSEGQMMMFYSSHFHHMVARKVYWCHKAQSCPKLAIWQLVPWIKRTSMNETVLSHFSQNHFFYMLAMLSKR